MPKIHEKRNYYIWVTTNYQPMIKFFRKIRQKMIKDNKVSKYLLYAIGEIALVVIGILIALQLNTNKENKIKSDLGYTYLEEMKNDLRDDFFEMYNYIGRLNKNIKRQEAALNTKNINELPLDSIRMIISPLKIDLAIGDLTFAKMKNLGITSITNNDIVTSSINRYYNFEFVDLKSDLEEYSEHYKNYIDFFNNKQDAIDFSFDDTEEFDFPALYKQSRKELNNQNRINSIKFITSIKGRMLIIKNLDKKKSLLRFMNYYTETAQKLIELIYDELKNNNPQIEPLFLFPSQVNFSKITLSKDALIKYVGKYKSEDNGDIIVSTEGKRIYVEFVGGSTLEVFPFEKDKFFYDSFFFHIQFNKDEDKDEIISLTQNTAGKKWEFIKIK